MSMVSTFVDKYFQTEIEESEQIREKYNAMNAKPQENGGPVGWDKLSVGVQKAGAQARTLVSEGNRTVMLLLPTPAGVAEISAMQMGADDHDEPSGGAGHKQPPNARTQQLWNLCRTAMRDGRIEKMARELGFERPKTQKTLGSVIVPHLTAKKENADSSADDSPPPVPSAAEEFTAPFRNLFQSDSNRPNNSRDNSQSGKDSRDPLEA
jgi:hypothetical protein